MQVQTRHPDALALEALRPITCIPDSTSAVGLGLDPLFYAWLCTFSLLPAADLAAFELDVDVTIQLDRFVGPGFTAPDPPMESGVYTLRVSLPVAVQPRPDLPDLRVLEVSGSGTGRRDHVQYSDCPSLAAWIRKGRHGDEPSVGPWPFRLNAGARSQRLFDDDCDRSVVIEHCERITTLEGETALLNVSVASLDLFPRQSVDVPAWRVKTNPSVYPTEPEHRLELRWGSGVSHNFSESLSKGVLLRSAAYERVCLEEASLQQRTCLPLVEVKVSNGANSTWTGRRLDNRRNCTEKLPGNSTSGASNCSVSANSSTLHQPSDVSSWALVSTVPSQQFSRSVNQSAFICFAGTATASNDPLCPQSARRSAARCIEVYTQPEPEPFELVTLQPQDHTPFAPEHTEASSRVGGGKAWPRLHDAGSGAQLHISSASPTTPMFVASSETARLYAASRDAMSNLRRLLSHLPGANGTDQPWYAMSQTTLLRATSWTILDGREGGAALNISTSRADAGFTFAVLLSHLTFDSFNMNMSCVQGSPCDSNHTMTSLWCPDVHNDSLLHPHSTQRICGMQFVSTGVRSGSSRRVPLSVAIQPILTGSGSLLPVGLRAAAARGYANATAALFEVAPGELQNCQNQTLPMQPPPAIDRINVFRVTSDNAVGTFTDFHSADAFWRSALPLGLNPVGLLEQTTRDMFWNDACAVLNSDPTAITSPLRQLAHWPEPELGLGAPSLILLLTTPYPLRPVQLKAHLGASTPNPLACFTEGTPPVANPALADCVSTVEDVSSEALPTLELNASQPVAGTEYVWIHAAQHLTVLLCDASHTVKPPVPKLLVGSSNDTSLGYVFDSQRDNDGCMAVCNRQLVPGRSNATEGAGITEMIESNSLDLDDCVGVLVQLNSTLEVRLQPHRNVFSNPIPETISTATSSNLFTAVRPSINVSTFTSPQQVARQVVTPIFAEACSLFDTVFTETGDIMSTNPWGGVMAHEAVIQGIHTRKDVWRAWIIRDVQSSARPKADAEAAVAPFFRSCFHGNSSFDRAVALSTESRADKPDVVVEQISNDATAHTTVDTNAWSWTSAGRGSDVNIVTEDSLAMVSIYRNRVDGSDITAAVVTGIQGFVIVSCAFPIQEYQRLNVSAARDFRNASARAILGTALPFQEPPIALVSEGSIRKQAVVRFCVLPDVDQFSDNELGAAFVINVTAVPRTKAHPSEVTQRPVIVVAANDAVEAELQLQIVSSEGFGFAVLPFSDIDTPSNGLTVNRVASLGTGVPRSKVLPVQLRGNGLNINGCPMNELPAALSEFLNGPIRATFDGFTSRVPACGRTGVKYVPETLSAVEEEAAALDSGDDTNRVAFENPDLAVDLHYWVQERCAGPEAAMELPLEASHVQPCVDGSTGAWIGMYVPPSSEVGWPLEVLNFTIRDQNSTYIRTQTVYSIPTALISDEASLQRAVATTVGGGAMISPRAEQQVARLLSTSALVFAPAGDSMLNLLRQPSAGLSILKRELQSVGILSEPGNYTSAVAIGAIPLRLTKQPTGPVVVACEDASTPDDVNGAPESVKLSTILPSSLAAASQGGKECNVTTWPSAVEFTSANFNVPQLLVLSSANDGSNSKPHRVYRIECRVVCAPNDAQYLAAPQMTWKYDWINSVRPRLVDMGALVANPQEPLLSSTLKGTFLPQTSGNTTFVLTGSAAWTKHVRATADLLVAASNATILGADFGEYIRHIYSRMVATVQWPLHVDPRNKTVKTISIPEYPATTMFYADEGNTNTVAIPTSIVALHSDALQAAATRIATYVGVPSDGPGPVMVVDGVVGPPGEVFAGGSIALVRAPGFDAVCNRTFQPPGVCEEGKSFSFSIVNPSFVQPQRPDVRSGMLGGSLHCPQDCPDSSISLGILYSPQCIGFLNGSICLEPKPEAKFCAFGARDDCQACGHGALCPGGFRRWNQAGYWTADARAPVVRCREPHSSRCREWNSTLDRATCAPGYDVSSAECSVCLSGYYRAPDFSCKACPSDSSMGTAVLKIIIFVALAAGAAVVAGLLILGIVLAMRKPVSEAKRLLRPSVAFVTWTISTLQTIAIAAQASLWTLPESVQPYVESLGIVVMTVPNATPVGCLSSPFVGKYVQFGVALATLIGAMVCSILYNRQVQRFRMEYRRRYRVRYGANSVPSGKRLGSNGGTGLTIIDETFPLDDDVFRETADHLRVAVKPSSAAKHRPRSSTTEGSTRQFKNPTLINADRASIRRLRQQSLAPVEPQTPIQPPPHPIGELGIRLFAATVMLYPVVLSSVLGLVHCVERTRGVVDATTGAQGTIQVTTLLTEESVTCYTSDHYAVLSVAAVVGVVFCVGLPLVTAMLLLCPCRSEQRLMYWLPSHPMSYFARKDFKARFLYHRHLHILILGILTIAQHFVLQYPAWPPLVAIVSLLVYAAILLIQKPYRYLHSWKMPVKVTVLVTSAMTFLVIYIAATAAESTANSASSSSDNDSSGTTFLGFGVLVLLICVASALFVSFSVHLSRTLRGQYLKDRMICQIIIGNISPESAGLDSWRDTCCSRQCCKSGKTIPRDYETDHSRRSSVEPTTEVHHNPMWLQDRSAGKKAVVDADRHHPDSKAQRSEVPTPTRRRRSSINDLLNRSKDFVTRIGAPNNTGKSRRSSISAIKTAGMTSEQLRTHRMAALSKRKTRMSVILDPEAQSQMLHDFEESTQARAIAKSIDEVAAQPDSAWAHNPLRPEPLAPLPSREPHAESMTLMPSRRRGTTMLHAKSRVLVADKTLLWQVLDNPRLPATYAYKLRGIISAMQRGWLAPQSTVRAIWVQPKLIQWGFPADEQAGIEMSQLKIVSTAMDEQPLGSALQFAGDEFVSAFQNVLGTEADVVSADMAAHGFHVRQRSQSVVCAQGVTPAAFCFIVRKYATDELRQNMPQQLSLFHELDLRGRGYLMAEDFNRVISSLTDSADAAAQGGSTVDVNFLVMLLKLTHDALSISA